METLFPITVELSLIGTMNNSTININFITTEIECTSPLTTALNIHYSHRPSPPAQLL